MKTYKVSTYNDAGAYTVSLNDDGIVDVDGLTPQASENLKFSVDRFMTKHNLPAITALGKAAGPYSFVTEIDAVADQTEPSEVI
jgi:hypothetical protein